MNQLGMSKVYYVNSYGMHVDYNTNHEKLFLSITTAKDIKLLY